MWEPYPLLVDQRLVWVAQRLPSLYGLVTETMRTVAAVHRVTEGQRLSGSFTVGLESLPVIYRCPRLDTIHPESRIPVTLPQTLGTVFLHARLGNVRTLLDVNYKSVGVIKEVDILCWERCELFSQQFSDCTFFPFECTIIPMFGHQQKHQNPVL